MLRFLTAALEDAEVAASWYESKRPGLGHEFLAELDRTIQRIETGPLAFAQLEYPQGLGEHVRRALIKRFPYLVIFVIQDEVVTVVAVEHASRQPGRWLHRLEEDG